MGVVRRELDSKYKRLGHGIIRFLCARSFVRVLEDDGAGTVNTWTSVGYGRFLIADAQMAANLPFCFNQCILMMISSLMGGDVPSC